MAEDCLFEVNERTAFPLQVSFFDEEGVAVVPTSATYRIDDEKNRTNIQAAVAISPLDSVIDLWITSDQNFIIRSRSPYEVRTVTVSYTYESVNGPTPANAQYKYKLLNLYGVVDVPSASVSPSSSASPSV